MCRHIIAAMPDREAPGGIFVALNTTSDSRADASVCGSRVSESKSLIMTIFLNGLSGAARFFSASLRSRPCVLKRSERVCVLLRLSVAGPRDLQASYRLNARAASRP